jgi:hypothetical protein
MNDGASLEETVQGVIEAGAIPVIPWGAGKWMGYRGRILKKFLENTRSSSLFMGDNSGRPKFWPRPSLFSVAESRGIRILPGSDPLPFVSQCQKPGSFGFTVEGAVTPEHPAADLKQLLLETSTRINAYGQLERPFRFIGNQLAMQILKRKRKRT